MVYTMITSHYIPSCTLCHNVSSTESAHQKTTGTTENVWNNIQSAACFSENKQTLEET